MQVKAKVISIKKARGELRECQHLHMVVDEKKNIVECDDCGAELNPVWALLRFANEESRWEYERKALAEIKAKIEQKRRTKCRHCGKMTDVRVR